MCVNVYVYESGFWMTEIVFVPHLFIFLYKQMISFNRLRKDVSPL